MFEFYVDKEKKQMEFPTPKCTIPDITGIVEPNETRKTIPLATFHLGLKGFSGTFWLRISKIKGKMMTGVVSIMGEDVSG